MRQLVFITTALILSVMLSLGVAELTAQANTPELGDAPVAALIDVAAPDEDGFVTITGAAGAVFPAAQIAIQNLYTEQIVYTTAGFTGAFSARIYGPGNTPFWISPAQNIPAALRDKPGSLPGGPGTIVYGAPPEARVQGGLPVTPIMIDGATDDWQGGEQAFANRDSLYMRLADAVPAGARLRLELTLNETTTYALTFDPALPQAALVAEVAPVPRDSGTLAVFAARSEDVLELRIPLLGLVDTLTAIRLERVVVLLAEDEILMEQTPAQALTIRDEESGIVYPGGQMTEIATRFSVSGPLAQGASTWTAVGRVDALSLTPGDSLTLELDAVLTVPELAESLVGLQLIGQIGLQPVVIAAEDGSTQPVVARYGNNGWSNVLTPSGLAIDNLHGDVVLDTVTIPAAQWVRRGDDLLAGFRFDLTLPDDLPPGIYVPTFSGQAQVGDGEVFAWEDSGVFGIGPGISDPHLTRLPLVLNVGDLAEARVPLTLFYNTPSDGSRGVAPDELAGQAALSNRVRYNSPTYILPPGQYALEPYVLNMLPNRYDGVAAPLLPLLFPGGRLNATITLPDGTVDTLPDTPITQNRLSTAELDERDLFGAQSPVDVYQLATSNTLYRSYPFEQYGDYTITLNGIFEDIYGNRYTGGGTYRLRIAELLDLMPGVLPGTPFLSGDSFFPGGHIAPGVPAAVDVRVMVYGLDGSLTETHFADLTTNAHGYFAPGQTALQFDAPGEYIIDYEARYTDGDGRLWAASLRSAGVIAGDDATWVAHGRRGVPGFDPSLTTGYRPAWFSTALYPPEESLDAGADLQRVYYPYFRGDVARLQDSREGGLSPGLSVQEVNVQPYGDWLLGHDPALAGRIAADEMPLMPVLGGPESPYGVALRPDFIVNEAYAYLSAVRPAVTVRQMVAGGGDALLPLYWDSDDPYNGQIGAGWAGDRPGDYMFLFGGGVIRNAEANISAVMPYAALAVVGDASQPQHVLPPYQGGEGGMAGGGPLLTALPSQMFFHPAGVRPGQVLTVGDRLVIAGQAAPTLRTRIEAAVTSPNGTVRRMSGLSNALGYYYQPQDDFTLDEAGVWTITLRTAPAGASSAGLPEPPLPVGGVLGTQDYTFAVFVLPEDSQPLEWTQGAGSIDAAFRAGVPSNFGIAIPTGWTEVEAFYSVTTPAYVLDSASLRPTGNTLSYQFSPAALSSRFPNYEADGRGGGPAASDPVTLTFVVSGLNADGQPDIRARVFTLFHDRLLSLEASVGE